MSSLFGSHAQYLGEIFMGFSSTSSFLTFFAPQIPTELVRIWQFYINRRPMRTANMEYSLALFIFLASLAKFGKINAFLWRVCIWRRLFRYSRDLLVTSASSNIFFFVFHFYVLWLNSSFAFVCCDFFFSRFRVFSLVYFIVCLQPASLLHARMRRYIESRKKSANLLYSDNLTFSFQSCITFVVVVAPIKCHVHHESTGNTHIFHRNNTLIIPYRTFLTRCMQYRQFRHFHVLLRHYGIVT